MWYSSSQRKASNQGGHTRAQTTVQKEHIITFADKWEDPPQALFISTVDGLTLCIVDTHFGNYAHGHWKQ
jgi:hypothetical protein